jgi:hypothetical protein
MKRRIHMTEIEVDEEMEEVTGYIYTHADCPYCLEQGDYEGDAQGETVHCTACGKDFKIGIVV